MKPAKVSVIVPVYNAEKTLKEMLEGLAQQTCCFFEGILVDDGSTDGSMEILREFAETHENFQVISHPGKGSVEARFAGIQRAQGEYIAFCDSDDVYHPDLLEKMVNTAEKTGADITVCGFLREDLETGRIHSVEMVHFEARAYEFPEAWDILPMINSALWNKLFRRDLLRHAIRFENPCRIAEDMMFCCSLYPFIRKIAFVPEPLYRYRIHSEGVMTNLQAEEMDLIRENMLKTRDCVFRENSGTEMRAFMDSTAFVHFGLSLPMRLIQKGEPLEKTVKEAEDYLRAQFPGYKRAGRTLAWNLSHQMRQFKILLGRWIFCAHLMRPFLAVYDFISRKCGKEIKW